MCQFKKYIKQLFWLTFYSQNLKFKHCPHILISKFVVVPNGDTGESVEGLSKNSIPKTIFILVTMPKTEMTVYDVLLM